MATLAVDPAAPGRESDEPVDLRSIEHLQVADEPDQTEVEEDKVDEGEEAAEEQIDEEQIDEEEIEEGLSIAAHRCYTVTEFSGRYCDDETLPDFKIIHDGIEMEPPGNQEIFHCYSAKCQVCLDLNKDMIAGEVYTNLQNLYHSAAEGCDTCDVLQKGIQKYVETVLFKDEDEELALPPLALVKISLEDGGPLSVHLSDPLDPSGELSSAEYYAHLQFHTPTGNHPPWPAFGCSRTLSATVSLDECISFAKEQIRDCDDHHAMCKSLFTKECPGRALDLGFKHTGTIRLTEYTADLGPYITLSHCWGKVQAMVTTTKSNYQERIHKISETELPKTFLDAVHIARGLGIRYLWIDSLCIVQDDRGDWEIESTKMADIYSGAYLTIAATRSSNCHGGCLSDRVTSNERPVETITVDCNKEGMPFQISVREALEVAHLDACFSSPTSETAPLFRRAWCFQERLLSPRLLHFHPDEMVWVCRGCTACECGNLQNLPSDSNQVLREEVRLLNRHFGDIEHNKLDHGEIWKIWKTIAELYPQLSITMESDRLPAMSGIATQLASVIPGSYLAGIWEENMPLGLGWLADQGASRRRQYITGVPSWSWMSMQVSGGLPPISFGAYFFGETFTPDPRFSLVEFDNTPATRNPFGALQNPQITIEGACIRRVCHFELDDFSFPCLLQGDDEDHPFYADSKPANAPSPDMPTPELVEGDEVLCLLLGTKGDKIPLENVIGRDDGVKDMALVLKRKEDGDYQRVGLYVDYLFKKWFSGPVETQRVVVV